MNVLRKPIAILSLFLFLFVGCGGGGSDFVTSSGQQGLTGPTGTVTLSHPVYGFDLSPNLYALDPASLGFIITCTPNIAHCCGIISKAQPWAKSG